MTRRTENWLFSAFMVGIAWLLAYIVAGVIVIAATEARCLEAGYPHVDVTWKFDRYCVREVNETEYVVPLEEIQ